MDKIGAPTWIKFEYDMMIIHEIFYFIHKSSFIFHSWNFIYENSWQAY
jgi:hypothetical protein